MLIIFFFSLVPILPDYLNRLEHQIESTKLQTTNSQFDTFKDRPSKLNEEGVNRNQSNAGN